MLHKSAGCRKQGNKRAHLKFSIFHSSNFNKLFVKTLRENIAFFKRNYWNLFKSFSIFTNLDSKMGSFSLLIKISCPLSISKLGKYDIFQSCNLLNTSYWLLYHCQLKLQKSALFNNNPLTKLPRNFSILLCFQLKHDFSQNFYEKNYHFLREVFKFLLKF